LLLARKGSKLGWAEAGTGKGNGEITAHRRKLLKSPPARRGTPGRAA
jgi:hypothetical protein